MYKKIGEFCEVRRGASPRPISDPKFFGGNVGWIRISDVTKSKKFLNKTEQYVSPLGESQSVKLDKGDLIMSICGTIGKPIILNIPACIHDGFVHFYNITGVDKEYLYHLLTFNEDNFLSMGQPGTQVNLNTSLVKGLKVFVPSLKEQRKISEVLTSLDKQIELTEQLISKYESVKQGMMKDLLSGKLRVNPSGEWYEESDFIGTEIGNIPKEWKIGVLENVLQKIIDYRGKTPVKTDHGIPLITAKNVKLGYISEEPREYISESEYLNWMTRGFPQIGDLLFTTEAPLGNVALLEKENIALAQRIVTLRVNEKMDSSLLKYILLSEKTRKQLSDKSSGSTVEGIKQSTLRKILICYPQNLEEQKRLIRTIHTLENKLEKENELLNKLKNLKKGLMQDLLTGNVRVKTEE